jgi:hypothetical protein
METNLTNQTCHEFVDDHMKETYVDPHKLGR